MSHTADIIKVGIAGAGHTVENVKEGLVENVMASMAGASHVADHVMGGIQGALACTGHTVENMKGGLVRANQLADHVRGELEIGGIKFGNTVCSFADVAHASTTRSSTSSTARPIGARPSDQSGERRLLLADWLRFVLEEQG